MEGLVASGREALQRLAEKGKGRKGLAIILVACLLPFLFLSGGWSVTDAPAGPSFSVGDLLLRLGAVLALLYGSLFALRSYLGGRGGQSAGGIGIRVLEKHRLSPQQSLYLVSVGERALLLGATTASISTLADLGPSDRFTVAAVGPAEAAPFSAHLRALGINFPGPSLGAGTGGAQVAATGAPVDAANLGGVASNAI